MANAPIDLEAPPTTQAWPKPTPDAEIRLDTAAEAAAADKPDLPDTVQTQDVPPRPMVPDQLKDYTKRWIEDTDDTPEFRDACRQYEEDIRTLLPDDTRERENEPDLLGPGARAKGRRKRSRAADREVNVARIYRSSQQILALVCPFGHTARRMEQKQVPAPGGGFGKGQRDQLLQQFARSIEIVEERYSREAGWVNIARSWVLRSIWFRASILKVAFHRDFGKDPLTSNRAVDEQDTVARLHYLTTKLMRGEITTRSAEFAEIQSLQKGLASGNEIEVYQGLNYSNIPINRYFLDSRVRSVEDLPGARFKGEKVTMSGEEILERWPYTPNEDGTWDGVHPEDLAGASRVDSSGNRLSQERIEAQKRSRERTRGPRAGNRGAESEFYEVREIWSRVEGKVIWVIDGLDYPLSTWVPEKPGPGFFPYFEMVRNPREGTWYGASDTELAAPIQSRINRKQSDEEKARWLSMGGRGVYDTTKNDGETIKNMGNTKPGSLIGLNLAGKDIRELVMWLQIPFVKESFNHMDDDGDLRQVLRLPEQALGTTDEKTTATAIRTAQSGMAASSKDAQDLIIESFKAVKRHVDCVLLQEVGPTEAEAEGGPFTFWPRVHDKAEAAQAMAKINAQVHQEMVAQEQQAMVQAAVAGQPYAPNMAMLDQRIAARTDELCVQQFGLPRPLSREELYRRLDVTITVSIDGAMDAENRVTLITKLLTGLVSAGMPSSMINFEPLGRLIASLMGEEDDMSAVLHPDPNLLVQTIAQIAQTDPKEISPESAGILAKLGIMAQQYLQQQAAAAPPHGAGAPAQAKPQGTP